jgi:cobalamin-dependent methionine synthase I
MKKVISEFKTKILAPLMIDSNSAEVIEDALKLI